MLRCGLKKGHQKRHCLKVIRLYAQNLLTILGSIVNVLEREPISDHLMSKRIFTLTMSSEKLWSRFGFAKYLVLIVCLML